MVLNADKISNIIIWIDMCANGSSCISPVESIANVVYEYVVVAVAEKMMYKSMYDKLIELGVEETKILWIKPIYLTEHYKVI